MSKEKNYLSEESRKTILDLAHQLRKAIILAHDEITINLPSILTFPEYTEARNKELEAQVACKEADLAVAKVELETKKFPLRYIDPKHPAVIEQEKAQNKYSNAINYSWSIDKRYAFQESLIEHTHYIELLIRRVK
jgi:hypothetical protein